MNMRLCWLLATLFVYGLVAPGHCAPPSLITYQGALADSSGKPLTGNFTMAFATYSTLTGGSPKWTENVPSVTVTNGVFTVVLGTMTSLPPGVAGCKYLQVSVGGTALRPRQQLTSAPYALQAANAGTLEGNASAFYRNASNLNAGTLAVARLPKVPGTKLAAGAVSGGAGGVIADGTIVAEDIANGAVVGAKIAPGAWMIGNSSTAMLHAENLSDAAFATGLHGLASASSGATYGVWGETQSSSNFASGIFGLASSTTGGWTNGVYGESQGDGGSGVYGSAVKTTGQGTGVTGESLSTSGVGVRGRATAASGYTTGVHGEVASANGIALEGYASDPNAYGLKVSGGKAYFAGPVDMAGTLYVTGYATFAGGHGDLAENYRAEEVEPGDVVVIGSDGKLVRCTKPSDTAVAGIVSTSPTMKLHGRLDDGEGVAPLALVGRVLCKVDASKAAIEPGDLLVSSGTPGHAMKCTSRRPAAGTVIGKALERLDKGTGVIQVLVTLR
jgi:hypothetical protein